MEEFAEMVRIVQAWPDPEEIKLERVRVIVAASKEMLESKNMRAAVQYMYVRDPMFSPMVRTLGLAMTRAADSEVRKQR